LDRWDIPRTFATWFVAESEFPELFLFIYNYPLDLFLEKSESPLLFHNHSYVRYPEFKAGGSPIVRGLVPAAPSLDPPLPLESVEYTSSSRTRHMRATRRPMMPEVVAGVRSVDSIPVCRTSRKKDPEAKDGASCSTAADNAAHALRSGRVLRYVEPSDPEESSGDLD
jgi:hypothetical protein